MTRSGKSKTIGKKRKALTLVSFPQPADLKTTSPPVGFFLSWAGPVFFAAALFLFFKNEIQVAIFLGFLGMLFQVAKNYSGQRPAWAKKYSGPLAPLANAALVPLWLAFV